jgi:hypothetical protein
MRSASSGTVGTGRTVRTGGTGRAARPTVRGAEAPMSAALPHQERKH